MTSIDHSEIAALVQNVEAKPTRFGMIHDAEVAKEVLRRVKKPPAWVVARILDSSHHGELLLFLPDHLGATTRTPLMPYATALMERCDKMGMGYEASVQAFADRFWELSFADSLDQGNASRAFDEVKKGWKGLKPQKLLRGQLPERGRWQDISASMDWVGTAVHTLHEYVCGQDDHRPLPKEPIPAPGPTRLRDGSRTYHGYDLDQNPIPGIIYAVAMGGVGDNGHFDSRGRKILEIASFCAGDRNRRRRANDLN